MHFWGHTYVQSIVRHLSDKSVAAGSLTPLMYTVLVSESCKFHTYPLNLPWIYQPTGRASCRCKGPTGRQTGPPGGTAGREVEGQSRSQGGP